MFATDNDRYRAASNLQKLEFMRETSPRCYFVTTRIDNESGTILPP